MRNPETLVFANVEALVPPGVATADYKTLLYSRTQEIAAAAALMA